jgi:hypothetical protein
MRFRSILQPGKYGENESCRNECIVCPSAFKAAMPVGASTTNRLPSVLVKFFKKVVFPVPALPVRKILRLVFAIYRSANSNFRFVSIDFGDLMRKKQTPLY